LRHLEVITTSKEFAVRLANLARAIRDRIQTVLAIETKNGPLTKLMKAFQQALIHELSADDFADMHAQTIAYGLLSARVANPAHDTADAVATHIPITNPFLKELMETFLHLGGRKRKERGGNEIDFDELGISEVVELLDAANMEAVIRDFGDRNRDEDPVIHFYVLFLKEYDAKKRIQRGVFYTPQPVVSYIVRSVHELLQTEFGLEDGLASTVTWGEMAAKQSGLKIPDGANTADPFVVILDPATGTATFLVEVIDVIRRTLVARWNRQRLTDAQQRAAWNAYVPKHLLPRLHGYELLMAPYAIAHMKIGLKLYETGYRFGSDERARIYLTNALEPPSDDKKQREFEQWVPALAHEAQAVNAIKRHQRFTVVIGNPPYSKASQNLGDQYLSLIEPFRMFSGERIREPGAILFERDINNDYVKFFGLNRQLIELAGRGVLGVITSNSYLDGKNFRGVRDALTACFNELSVLTLHGDRRSGALARQGIVDENVFDIDTGVCIVLAIRTRSNAACTEVAYCEAIGTYGRKASLLLDYDQSLHGKAWQIDPRRYKSFLPSESSVLNEYAAFRRLDEAYGLAVDGIKTSRDGLVIANTPTECASKIQAFMSFSGSAGDLEQTSEMGLQGGAETLAEDILREANFEARVSTPRLSLHIL
jgi:predicted helicase